jgi:hypothetical protein
MRYRLMAIYLGVPYYVGLGPDGNEATLFSPAPPPDELGFTPAGAHWRKQVLVSDLDALWQSRLVGEYRGEPCLVLDDLGDRLHIAYLGRDSVRASQLGYWEIDREVFEVVVDRQDLGGLTEERVDYPLASVMFPPSNRDLAAQPRTQTPGRGASGLQPGAPQLQPGAPQLQPARPQLQPGGPQPGGPQPGGPQPGGPQPGGPPAAAAERTGPLRAVPRHGSQPASTPDRVAAWHGSPEGEPWAEAPPEPRPDPWPGPQPAFRADSQPDPRLAPADRRSEPWQEGWPMSGPWSEGEAPPEPEPQAGPPAGRRAGRRDRVPQSVFAELLTLAAIPHAAYAVDEEVPGAMCLVKADGGFEVFSRTDDARLDVRFFEDEEAAYFYLFGVLAAEAVSSGRLRPATANGHVNGSRGPEFSPAPRENVSKYLRDSKLPKSAPHPVIVN